MSLRQEARVPCDMRASPNHDERRDGRAADMLILHYTGMADAEQALAWLCDPASKVSSHYFVFEDGRTVQMVPEARRAWHAGVSFWRGDRDINSASIGIEISNPGHDHGYADFPDAQMRAVEALCIDIVRRHAIAPARVLAHSDVAPARKCDPGEKFDWARLAGAGIGVWADPAPPGAVIIAPGDAGEAVAAMKRDLAAIGYEVETGEVFDEATRLAVTAFQRHFRPARVDGKGDESTITAIACIRSSMDL